MICNIYLAPNVNQARRRDKLIDQAERLGPRLKVRERN